jgi:hypothetical protein
MKHEKIPWHPAASSAAATASAYRLALQPGLVPRPYCSHASPAGNTSHRHAFGRLG